MAMTPHKNSSSKSVQNLSGKTRTADGRYQLLICFTFSANAVGRREYFPEASNSPYPCLESCRPSVVSCIHAYADFWQSQVILIQTNELIRRRNYFAVGKLTCQLLLGFYCFSVTLASNVAGIRSFLTHSWGPRGPRGGPCLPGPHAGLSCLRVCYACVVKV